MKSILTFILATFLLFPLQAQEKVYTVDNLPKVRLSRFLAGIIWVNVTI